MGVEFKRQRWFLRHNLTEIVNQKGVGTTTEIRDVAAKKIRLPLCNLGCLQNAHAGGPVHVRDSLILVRVEHIVRDDHDATGSKLMGDAHMGYA